MAGLLEERAVLLTPVARQGRLFCRLLGGQWVSANHQVQLVAGFGYERHHQAAVKVSRPDVINLPGPRGAVLTRRLRPRLPNPEASGLTLKVGQAEESPPPAQLGPHRDKAIGSLFILCNCLWLAEEQDTDPSSCPHRKVISPKPPIAESVTGLQWKQTTLGTEPQRPHVPGKQSTGEPSRFLAPPTPQQSLLKPLAFNSQSRLWGL